MRFWIGSLPLELQEQVKRLLQRLGYPFSDASSPSSETICDIALVYLSSQQEITSSVSKLSCTFKVGIIDNTQIRALGQLIQEEGLDDYLYFPFEEEVFDAKVTILKRAFLQNELLNETYLALQESEAKANAILKETVSGIITIDEEGAIESFNPAAERIFGYTAEEVMGANISILMPQPYRQEHAGYMRNYLSTGEAKIIGIGREVTGLRKNGDTFPLELAVSEVTLSNRRIFCGITRDISARRQLERELLSVSEYERRTIGQDLHDGLGQMLTGIGLMMENLRQNLSHEKSQYVADVEKILTYMEEADTFARYLSRGLVPVQVEANGLATALALLADQAEKIFKIACTFTAIGDTEAYSSPDAIHLYRIAQEAISNGVKHGKATYITIHFAVGQDQVRLRVQNNGIPFPEVLPAKRGMGLHIITHRARVLGASLDIRPLQPKGTVLTCTLPLR